MTRRIIRLLAVLTKTNLSKSTIRREELKGKFPRRIELGPNSVGWFEDEIDDYLESLPRKPLRDSGDSEAQVTEPEPEDLELLHELAAKLGLDLVPRKPERRRSGSGP